MAIQGLGSTITQSKYLCEVLTTTSGLLDKLQSGYAFQGTPATGSDRNGNFEVFALGSDKNIWHNVYTGSWGSWFTLQ